MNNRKRIQTHHDEKLKQRLKKLIGLTILIPTILLVAFIFFGPQISTVFGLISSFRGSNTQVKVNVSVPVFRDPPTAVNTTKVSINGFAEAGTTIKLYVNGPEKSTTVTPNDGVFAFRDVTLINGRNTLFAKATDQNGNESEKSQTITIVVDIKKPKITIETPQNDEVIKNLDERILIKGSIDKKATVKINDRFAIQKPDLTFELLLGVEQGEVEFKIEATDEAGNVSVEELKITYVRESS